MQIVINAVEGVLRRRARAQLGKELLEAVEKKPDAPFAIVFPIWILRIDTATFSGLI